MSNVIMIGCDLHDETMLLKIANGLLAPETLSVKNTARGREGMIANLKRRAQAVGGARLVFAYEASGLGFGLYDQLTAAGIECYVLAPTRIAHSQRQRSQKTDEKDALELLELLRAHILAGNSLPKVWIPKAELRDDRELVRMRLDVGDKVTSLKTQIKSLLKRYHLYRPPALGKGWTKSFRVWLSRDLASPADPQKIPLGAGGRAALASLLRQLIFLEQECECLDQEIITLAWSPRYEKAMLEVTKLCGVGVLTGMVFLTELGDLSRFANRRQLAAYLGLVPSSYETGKSNDRKGHITHQGSSRVRKALCQATWSRVRYDPDEKAAYDRIKAKNPKHKKIAVVASMRRLSVRMWHCGQTATAAPEETRQDQAKPHTECGCAAGFSEV